MERKGKGKESGGGELREGNEERRKGGEGPQIFTTHY